MFGSEREREKVRESVCTNKTRENCGLILFHYALKGNLIISLFTVCELQASVWASLMTTLTLRTFKIQQYQ